MVKKYRKIIPSALLFIIFLTIGVFGLSIKTATGLEVQYPSVPSIMGAQELAQNAELPAYVKYVFYAGVYIGGLVVFISLAIAGVMYFLSPVFPSLLSKAREWVSGAITGLLIFLFMYAIIATVNPQLNIFNFNKPTQAPTAKPEVQKSPGVYFYTKAGCSDTGVQPNISSVADLGELKNRTNSVGMVQGTGGYISIIYANTNYWGKCQAVDPNKPCTSFNATDTFANSASIYKYDYNPQGDGVYFYHNSCFNNQLSGRIDDLIAYCNQYAGGYYKISNSQIKNLYNARLNTLKFQNTPDQEKDCIKYEKDGSCAKDGRMAPTLDGENISSIIINGDYLVLLIYADPKDEPNGGPWTSCQSFPLTSDTNKIGPQQIKWENIRNMGGVLPNNVIIFPVASK